MSFLGKAIDRRTQGKGTVSPPTNTVSQFIFLTGIAPLAPQQYSLTPRMGLGIFISETRKEMGKKLRNGYRYQYPFQSWARENCIKFRDSENATMKQSLRDENKIRKVFRSRCRDGVATPKIVKLQLQTTLWSENLVSLSRQYCRVPSSAPYYDPYLFPTQT